MKKRFLLSVLIGGILIFSFACMAPTFRDLTRKTFSAPEFTTYELETGKIALLPTVASSEYARPLEIYLIESFQAYHPGITAIGGAESRTFLNNAGLVAKYSQMVDTYDKLAILDKSIVMKMGRAVGARYLMYTRMLKYDEFAIRDQDGTINRKVYELSIKAEIWDSRTGEAVWDATGHGRIEQTMLDKPATFEDVAMRVCDSIMQRLP
ncbi:MAG: hypothetical protein ACE5WD_11445 [Candidatus Aminicenantia bacterium]